MIKIMKISFAVLISLVSTSTSIFAWDGNRQGFLWGFGAGTNSQTVIYDAESPGELESEELSTSITNFRIGYAPQNNYAMLLYGHGLWNLLEAGSSSYYAINYQRWSHDEPQSNIWFGGIGLIADSYTTTYKDRSGSDPDYGVGINFGYGREIVEHVSIETNLTIGGMEIDGDDLLFVGFNTTFNLLGY